MNGQRDVFAEMKKRERVALLQEADQKRKEQDTYNVMHTEEGRRFVYQILKACGVYAPSFNTNALTMAFNEGKRAIGVALVEQLRQSCNEFYSTMLEEQSGEHK